IARGVIGSFLRPVGKLKIEKVLSRRERQCSFVTEHFVLDRIEAIFRKRIGYGFLLGEDEFVVVLVKNGHAYLDGIGVWSVIFLGDAQIARTVQADRIVDSG